jgi:uncharacterized protein (TIGR02145 family)
MKTKNRIWICHFILMGYTLILINSCKKDEKNPNSITDKDGNVYTSVIIGTQVWIVENLKTTRYSNGDLIGTTTPATLDISLESTPKYQWSYEGNESNVNSYGRLYTWYTVTDSRNICPTGWHVATDADWTTLTTFLGGESISGGKLKEAGTTHWITPNTGATNESGFTALPSGYRNDDGIFANLGYIGIWWCSTEYSSDRAYFRDMGYNFGDVLYGDNIKKSVCSVRCLKDN